MILLNMPDGDGMLIKVENSKARTEEITHYNF